MVAGLPDIIGSGLNTEAAYYKNMGNVGGAFYIRDMDTQPDRSLPAGNLYVWVYYNFSAKRSNLLYGSSATVTPLSRKACFIIKY